MIISRFINVAANGIISFFLWLSDSLLYICTISYLSVHLLMDISVVSTHVLAIFIELHLMAMLWYCGSLTLPSSHTDTHSPFGKTQSQGELICPKLDSSCYTWPPWTSAATFPGPAMCTYPMPPQALPSLTSSAGTLPTQRPWKEPLSAFISIIINVTNNY